MLEFLKDNTKSKGSRARSVYLTDQDVESLSQIMARFYGEAGGGENLSCFIRAIARGCATVSLGKEVKIWGYHFLLTPSEQEIYWSQGRFGLLRFWDIKEHINTWDSILKDQDHPQSGDYFNALLIRRIAVQNQNKGESI